MFCILFAALENCRKNLKNLKNGLLFIKFYAMIIFVPGCGSAWLERRLREAEVASSNPATPIHCKVLDFQGLFLYYISCCIKVLFCFPLYFHLLFPYSCICVLNLSVWKSSGCTLVFWKITPFYRNTNGAYLRHFKIYALLSECQQGLSEIF